MSKRRGLISIILALFGLVSLIHLDADKPLDLSETFLKIKNSASFFDFGANGFAVFDWGDKKIKLLNWNFEITNSLPITMGEGPGEIKQDILSICLIKDNNFVNGLLEKKINVYDKKGSFIKTFPVDFIPRKMLFKNNNLYIFNIRVNVNDDSHRLGQIIEPGSGTSIKDITLKNKLESEKVFEGNILMTGFASLFDVGTNRRIYLLISATSTIYELGEDGKLLRKISLPYKDRIVYRKVKEGKKEHTLISVLDWYRDMKVIDNIPYACYHKHIRKDKKTGSDIYKTYVIRIPQDGRFSERILDGQFVLIGEHQGILYLFNTENYQAISLKFDKR